MEYIKVCGLKKMDDIETSIKYSANVVGFIYNVPSSPRNLNKFQIESLLKQVPNKIMKVIVFKPQSIENLKKTIEDIKVDLYQIHVNFSIKELKKIPKKLKKNIILALKVNKDNKELVINKIKEFNDQFFAFLIDNSEGHGNKVDIQLVKEILNETSEARFIVAGGIAEDNIEEIYRKLKPYGIDVSSSLESEKGVKDPLKIKLFLKKIKKLKNEIRD